MIKVLALFIFNVHYQGEPDHSKNGAQPKSHKSRKSKTNKMKNLYLTLFIFAINAIGYSQCSVLKNFNNSNYGYSGTEVLNDKMIFKHRDNISGEELWSSDGTTAGTVLIKDIYPGFTGSSLKMMGLLNNNYYFFANDGVNGNELWKTDGTTKGTMLVKNFASGALGVVGAESCNGKVIGNQLFFVVALANNQWNLWKTDGTDAGTEQLTSFTYNFSGGVGFETLGEKLFFNYNNKVYVSDGTKAGTQQFGDFNIASNTTTTNYFIKFKNQLYFFVPFNKSNQTTYQLWKTDGTLSGTSKVVDTYLGQQNYLKPPGMVAVDDNNFYFDSCEARELWVSDGTAANTKKIKFFDSVIANMKLINGVLYFSAYENRLSGLWKSDGTLAGTTLIKNVPFFSGNVQGNEGYGTNRFYDYNNTLLFYSYGGLYTSDGTSSGTVLSCSLSQDVSDFLIRYNNSIYFFTTASFYKYDTASLALSDYNIESTDLSTVFPNPTESILNIQTSNAQIQKVELYDLQGRLVISEIGKDNKHLLNIAHLEKATYILVISTDSGVQNTKIIKH